MFDHSQCEPLTTAAQPRFDSSVECLWRCINNVFAFDAVQSIESIVAEKYSELRALASKTANGGQLVVVQKFGNMRNERQQEFL